MTLQEQNDLRREASRTPFDPITGEGCDGARVDAWRPGSGRVSVPAAMVTDPDYQPATMSADDFDRIRCRHDFAFWCARCVMVKDKSTGAQIPFILNRPQRRVAAMLEADRHADRPIRLIMLKARQWGGSTLVQMYMAWIQSCHRRNWHSVICAHVKDTAATIRGMYTKVLESYPAELWEGDAPGRFSPFERSTNVREIAGRGCRVTVSSAENQEALRGSDLAMAHLSEVAFWASTTQKDPSRIVRSICGSIDRKPLTLIVMESTANGVGNYFHREWLRAVDAASDKRPVFVPWHEIDIYAEPLAPGEHDALWQSLDDYERSLWDVPTMTLERIKWYHNKRREYADHAQMMAEYPSTADEAFAYSGVSVFAHDRVEALREGCREPIAVGEVTGVALVGPEATVGVSFRSDRCGHLEVWEHPAVGHEYIAAMDIGGRSSNSDWSVIGVLDVTDTRPRVVAQWRGHLDHDLLTWRAAALATYYNRALLVIESNTLESETTEGDNSLYALEALRDGYSNLYLRESHDSLRGPSYRVGFHTNRATKPLVINTLIAAIRDATYDERDSRLVDELISYEQLPNGAYAARPGCHDDILMTRAIALHIALTHASSPQPTRAHLTPLLSWSGL